MGRPRLPCSRRDALLSTDIGEFENFGLMRLLFETPSGFAIFSASEFYLNYPGIVENVWAEFRCEYRASKVVSLREFQTFEDKSAAINADTGVNQQLAGMIERWHLPRMKLGVAKPEYKRIIESKLGITCLHNEAVMEVMWGIEQLMRILVPDEKAELTKEDRLPMSQGLKMLLSRYGFDVEPEMINKRIIVIAQTVCACEAVELKFLRPLRNDALFLKAISGINSEHWDALKLGTALMMLSSHGEEIDSHEVFTQDELSKLKIEGPKYKDIVFKCNRLMYKELASAYKIKLAKKKLLGSLVKKARKAGLCKKGKLQGESESQQIPQEHVIFANLCRTSLPVISTSKPYVHELPLPKPKVLKRPRDSSFEPTVANKHIFSEGSEEECQAHVCSGLPASARPPKSAVSLPTAPSVSKPSTPLFGKVVRRSPRLNQNIDCYQHAQLEDIPRKRSKKTVCPQNKCSA